MRLGWPVQLSPFQVRTTPTRRVLLEREIAGLIDRAADRVLFIDLGPVEDAAMRLRSLGAAITTVVREPMFL